MQRPKKIAVISKANYKFQARDYRIDYYVWGKLSEFDSLSDYDILVVDLASMRNRNTVRWHIFEKIVNAVVTKDILTGGGRIIIVGNPNFQHQSVLTKRRIPFLGWTGLSCEWVDQSGDTIIPAQAEMPDGIERYITHLDRWNGALRTCDVYPGFAKMLTRHLSDGDTPPTVTVDMRHYYRNRYNCALAFEVYYQIEHADQAKETESLGPIMFLPETTLGGAECIEIILRDICGVVTASREPGWAMKLALPNHDEVDQEIIERMADIERHYERLAELERTREQAREALRLLYDSGSTLEEIVRVIMDDLGAEVTEPEEVGADSGRIEVSVHGQPFHGLLSVVAIGGSEFSEKELDKLGRRLSLAIETSRREYKGIFVGNASVDKPLEDRSDPFNFHFNENAKLRHVALLQTQDLYELYIMHLTDSLDREKFWSELFSTDGQFDMRRLRQAGPAPSSIKAAMPVR
ncbi:hypothetical protein GF377_10930 [candidate division GN15 bacterium]|nr:hypothetical protein [candidate division GN15 bacterium]